MSQLADLARPFKRSLIHPPAEGKFGSYVSHDAVTQKLLAVCGPYSFRVARVITDGEIVTGIVGALTIAIDGREVTVEEAGDVENPSTKKTNGARMKDASSDAIKRCAMRLGVGLHLWSDEYFLYDVLKDSDAGAIPSEGDPAVSVAGSVSVPDPALSSEDPWPGVIKT